MSAICCDLYLRQAIAHLRRLARQGKTLAPAHVAELRALAEDLAEQLGQVEGGAAAIGAEQGAPAHESLA